MTRALLINPSYSATYGATKVGVTNPIMPTLGLATIAAEALRRGHRVSILDMSHRPYDWRLVRDAVLAARPDVVGITATTPLMNQMRDISVLCKDIAKDMVVVGGGPHVSALPEESLRESMLDAVAAGEADLTFGEICDGAPLARVRGLYRRDAGDAVVYTGDRPLIDDLDDLPLPAWHLYDAPYYRDKMSRLLARRPPVTMAEFSRGCVYRCDFCASKNTMALGYRKKSPERCAEEAVALKKLGWGEFMLADDIFTTDGTWAGRVCDALARGGTGLAWSCTNGIRVESADGDLFERMRAAGCYRVSFGFESGNDAVLRAFGKGGRASIEQGRRAIRLARAAGLDTNGFFLLGLSADTEETMRETVEFARSLELDMLKFGITIALPGTPMFHDFSRRGLIRSYEWDDYHAYTSRHLFAHPRLDYDTIQRWMRHAYRRAIMTNPRFIARRARRGIVTGEFLWDVYYFLKFAAAASLNAREETAGYYARPRWPRHDFAARGVQERAYRRAAGSTAGLPPHVHDA